MIQSIQRLEPIFFRLENAIAGVTNRPVFSSIELYRNKISVVMSHTVVVAAIGGVKAGKSTVFQSLCKNLKAAKTGVEHLTHRPLAYSRHGLVPSTLQISELFPEFDVLMTDSAESATRTDVPANRLWWMIDESAPEGMIFIDSPDLNSMQEINRELAFRLSKASDIIFLVMLGGANAYAADIKKFASEALQMGRMVVPVLTKMDDEKSARIVLDEFCREMAPLLNNNIPYFQYAFYMPVVPQNKRDQLKNIQLQPLFNGSFINLDNSEKRAALKAEIWYNSYEQFHHLLNREIIGLKNETTSWLHFWRHIESALDEWGQKVAALIFPRNLILHELIAWYEETQLTFFRKVMRRINPINWPGYLYTAIRKWVISQSDRERLQEQAQQTEEKLRNKLQILANTAWVKIWGKEAPKTTGELVTWQANHMVNPTLFVDICKKLVLQSVMMPFFGAQWQVEFRRDLEAWWRSADESNRQKRTFLEYSQLTLDFISWLALPATFFLPGSADTIIVGVAQPIFTFINQHFLFLDSHFVGARERWIRMEANRLKNNLLKSEQNLESLVQTFGKWRDIDTNLHALEIIFSDIDSRIKLILEKEI